MSGKKGMLFRRPKQGTDRSKAWNSMRQFVRFNIPDLCRTSGGSVSNVQKFVRNLVAHGYVAKYGKINTGQPGSYQPYRLVKDVGPTYPMVCEWCGRPMTASCEKEIDDG